MDVSSSRPIKAEYKIIQVLGIEADLLQKGKSILLYAYCYILLYIVICIFFFHNK